MPNQTVECEVRTYDSFDFELSFDTETVFETDGEVEAAGPYEDNLISAESGEVGDVQQWRLTVFNSSQLFGEPEPIAEAFDASGSGRRFRFDGVQLLELEGNQEFYEDSNVDFDPTPEEMAENVVFLVNESSDPVFIIPRSAEFLPSNVSATDFRLRGSHIFANFFTLAAGETKRFRTTANHQWVYDVFEWDESLLGSVASPTREGVNLLDFCIVELDGGATVVWDGDSLDCADLPEVELCLCNETDTAAAIVLEGDDPFQSVIPPGQCRVVSAFADKPLKVSAGRVLETGYFREFGTVVDSVSAGDKVILDQGLRIETGDDGGDDDPVETVAIKVCNFDEFNNYPNVIMTVGEPADGVALGLGDCGELPVPIGAPAEIRMFDEMGSTLVATCTIDDPSENDDVQWDGLSLICSDRD